MRRAGEAFPLVGPDPRPTVASRKKYFIVALVFLVLLVIGCSFGIWQSVVVFKHTPHTHMFPCNVSYSCCYKTQCSVNSGQCMSEAIVFVEVNDTIVKVKYAECREAYECANDYANGTSIYCWYFGNKLNANYSDDSSLDRGRYKGLIIFLAIMLGVLIVSCICVAACIVSQYRHERSLGPRWINAMTRMRTVQ